MPRTPEQHSADSKAAAYTRWSGIADRAGELRGAHENSPSGDNWHARRLFGSDVDLASLTPKQWEQVADARLAWLRAKQLNAVEARKRKAKERRMAEIDQEEAELTRIEAKARGEAP